MGSRRVKVNVDTAEWRRQSDVVDVPDDVPDDEIEAFVELHAMTTSPLNRALDQRHVSWELLPGSDFDPDRVVRGRLREGRPVLDHRTVLVDLADRPSWARDGVLVEVRLLEHAAGVEESPAVRAVKAKADQRVGGTVVPNVGALYGSLEAALTREFPEWPLDRRRDAAAKLTIAACDDLEPF